MVEKVPDSTYEMVGGLDKQIKEIKEVIELPVKHPELFDALGISQPKVRHFLSTQNRSEIYFLFVCVRVFCCTVHQERVKPCSLELLPTTQNVHLFVYRVLNSSKSLSAKVQEWFENYS